MFQSYFRGKDYLVEVPDYYEKSSLKLLCTNARGSTRPEFGNNGALRILTVASRNCKPNQLLPIFEAASQNGLSGTGLYQKVRYGKNNEDNR